MPSIQTGAQLRDRDWLVRVHGTDVTRIQDIEMEFTGLDIDFRIQKSERPEPNCISLNIYNLTSEQRQSLERLNLYDPKKVKGVKSKREAGRTLKGGKNGKPRAPKKGRIQVEIEAGYKSTGRSLLFRGDLRRAISSQQGASWLTKIEGEDGGRSLLSSRINESFPAGTTLEVVVRACAEALGVGLGNILEVQSLLRRTFSHGTVCSGPASDELRGVLRGAGVAYSIQNGVLALRESSPDPVSVDAYVLDESTGLVGVPERDANGTVEATCLLIPNISVGSHVTLASEDYRGTYRVVSVEHNGSTKGQAWYHKLELRAA